MKDRAVVELAEEKVAGQLSLVSLCYVGLTTDRMVVLLPALKRYGFHVTFALEPRSLLSDVRRWREAADAGHELANGPLTASAVPDGSLPAFGQELVRTEVDDMERLLHEVIGSRPHCIVLPGGVDRCAEGPYAEKIARKYPLVVLGTEGENVIGAKPPGRINRIVAAGKSPEDLMRLVTQRDTWSVIVFDQTNDNHEASLEALAALGSAIEVKPVSAARDFALQSAKSRVSLT